uniref:Uncharacterized protein n=1 Tax=Rhizophora mucronata TaxID=61149 RepID=A0A2P2IU50_RHIMU
MYRKDDKSITEVYKEVHQLHVPVSALSTNYVLWISFSWNCNVSWMIIFGKIL